MQPAERRSLALLHTGHLDRRSKLNSSGPASRPAGAVAWAPVTRAHWWHMCRCMHAVLGWISRLVLYLTPACLRADRDALADLQDVQYHRRPLRVSSRLQVVRAPDRTLLRSSEMPDAGHEKLMTDRSHDLGCQFCDPTVPTSSARSLLLYSCSKVCGGVAALICSNKMEWHCSTRFFFF